jgi:hypothetical protein
VFAVHHLAWGERFQGTESGDFTSQLIAFHHAFARLRIGAPAPARQECEDPQTSRPEEIHVPTHTAPDEIADASVGIAVLMSATSTSMTNTVITPLRCT